MDYLLLVIDPYFYNSQHFFGNAVVDSYLVSNKK